MVIVETGSQVLGADSFVSEAELEAYADKRGIAITGDSTTLLLEAASYCEGLQFLGNRLTKAQKMEWPRSGVVLSGFAVATDEIPDILKTLQIEVALFHDVHGNPRSNIERLAISEQVGSIAVTYSDKSPLKLSYSQVITTLANKLIGRSSGGMSVPLFRS